MAHDPTPAAKSGTVLVRNIGLMLSGDIDQPVLEADSILIEDGRITKIGVGLAADGATTTIDANGCAVCPGLIDNHVHTVAGDWTPRQNQMGWIESSVHGGVTTFISAGEAHYPGRPRDPVGVKALAIAAQRSFAAFRPLGARIIAGAPIPEAGLTAADFQEMAAAGVTITGELGLGTINDGPTGRKVFAWARAAGMTSTTHTGGPSIPGSSRIGADIVLEADADIVAHVNGGPTALPIAELRRIVEGGNRALEIVHNGNLRAGLEVLAMAAERSELGRVILGTDGPAGSGAQPLGIMRTIVHLASLSDVPPEAIICMATGNTARVRQLADRGVIAVGRFADLVFMDQAEGGGGDGLLDSMVQGNVPGIGMIMVDGIIRLERSRNTPPAARIPTRL